LGFTSEKPAIDWQSRVFQKCFVLESEPLTRAASKTGAALPNSDNHVGVDRRVLQTFSRHGVHVQRVPRNTISGRLSKDIFTFKSSISQGLSAAEVVLN
jgi:hypothetical protein